MTGQNRRAAESARWDAARRDDQRRELRDVSAASDEAPVPLAHVLPPLMRCAVRATLRALIVAGLVASAVTVLLGLGHVAASVERFGQAATYASR